MNPEVEDAKAGAAPSAAQGATVDSPTTTDATGTRPPEGDKATSPAAGDTKPGSLSEALEKVQLEMPAEETAGADDGQTPKAEDSPTTEAKPGETKPTEVAAQKDDPAAKKGQGTQELDAPFHKRPEWQAAEKFFKANPQAEAALKPILRQAFEAETRANETVRKLQPAVDVLDEMKRITGGEREFNTMRQIVRQYSAGDPAVLPMLRQMVQTMERHAGEVLSSPDLVGRQQAIQKQFDEGHIDANELKSQSELLKEVERNRAGKRQAETRLTTTQKTQQQQQAAQAQQQQVEAVNSWESNIRQRDPDFGDVTDVNDPKHGQSIADQVFDAMSLKFMHNPTATTDDLLAEAQRAYTMAKGRSPGPALRQQRVVTSQRSSVTGRQAPRTMREAMDSVKLE